MKNVDNKRSQDHSLPIRLAKIQKKLSFFLLFSSFYSRPNSLVIDFSNFLVLHNHVRLYGLPIPSSWKTTKDYIISMETSDEWIFQILQANTNDCRYKRTQFHIPNLMHGFWKIFKDRNGPRGTASWQSQQIIQTSSHLWHTRLFHILCIAALRNGEVEDEVANSD